MTGTNWLAHQESVYHVSITSNRLADNDLQPTNLADGWRVKFFLECPLFQRQNGLNLKEPQTIFGCLWFETAATWTQYRWEVKR